MATTHDLKTEYINTGYMVHGLEGREHELRIEEIPSRQFVEDVKAQNVKSWVFVTAVNPGSEKLSDQENNERQQKLVEHLQQNRWLYFEGYSEGDDGLWPTEPSVCVMGMTREQGITLGQLFGQRAIVFGEATDEFTPHLVWCGKTEE